MHEQVDRPSTLMTGWLNLYTPVGREHVGHNRVDHEKEEYARDGRRIAYACRPELLWDIHDTAAYAGDFHYRSPDRTVWIN